MNVESTTRRRTPTAGMISAAITVAVAGCASHPAAGPVPTGQGRQPSMSSSVPGSSPAEAARQQALTAYRGMWFDFVAAGVNSDWQSPTLGQYATGIALTNLSRGLYADHYNGLVTKGAPILNPSVSSEDPPNGPKKIVITDCGDSTNWLKYRTDNGQLADDKPGGRQLINAIVEKQADGSWRVSDVGVHEVGTC